MDYKRAELLLRLLEKLTIFIGRIEKLSIEDEMAELAKDVGVALRKELGINKIS